MSDAKLRYWKMITLFRKRNPRSHRKLDRDRTDGKPGTPELNLPEPVRLEQDMQDASRKAFYSII